MKTITAVVFCTALAAGSAGSAFAQKTGAFRSGPGMATKPLIQCTAGHADARASRPCKSRQETEAVRYASDLTRQEFECTLSGHCAPTGNAGRTGDVATL